MGRCAVISLDSFFFSALAALLCGFFSGLGVGGGSLLMVWMTAVCSLDQRMAQGINLLYYLPTAGIALLFHNKNKLVDWKAALPALLCGAVTAALFAWLSSGIDTGLLRKLFGGLLLLLGGWELFRKK